MWEIFLKKLAVRLNLPSPRHPSVSGSETRGEASPPRSTGCCSTRAAPPTAATESQNPTRAELEGPPPSSKQVSPIHSSAGTSHRVRKQKQKGAECLSDPFSYHVQHILSKVQDSSPCLQQLQPTRKMVQVLLTHTWQDNKQKVTMQLLSPPHHLGRESLGLKANHIITTSLCFKEGSELPRYTPDEVAKLLMQAQWNQALTRCYYSAHLFVLPEAINSWWTGARAREAMIYQHLQCQCSSTSWSSTAKKINQYSDLKSFTKTEETEDHQVT